MRGKLVGNKNNSNNNNKKTTAPKKTPRPMIHQLHFFSSCRSFPNLLLSLSL
jgi:hypothetical protein